jgi:hypothetical protein
VEKNYSLLQQRFICSIVFSGGFASSQDKLLHGNSLRFLRRPVADEKKAQS